MLLVTRGGRTLIDRPVEGAFLPTRALLQAAMRDAVGDAPVVLGRGAVELVSAARGEVRLADGERRSADLVPAADGMVGGGAGDRGRRGALLRLRRRRRAVGSGGRRDAGRVAAGYRGRHERFGVCDLGGGRRYWFFKRTAPTLAELAARAEGWPAHVRDTVMATPADRLIPWPIHARPAMRRLARGRVVHVGDAGRAMEPNLGQGACQAIEDAAALGAVAARADPADVPALWGAMRLARVRRVGGRAADGGRAVHGPVVVQVVMRAALTVMPDALEERVAAGVQTMPDHRGGRLVGPCPRRGVAAKPRRRSGPVAPPAELARVLARHASGRAAL